MNAKQTIYIPDYIKSIVKDKPFRVDGIGMSDSKVLIYDDYVLKIRPGTEETQNERLVSKWAKGRVPVPEILALHSEGGMDYELMTRMKGDMLCSDELMKQPREVIRLAAEGLRMLWSVDVTGCPSAVSLLSERLILAEKAVSTGNAESNAEPETYGPEGFSNPEELLSWLENNRPSEDIVLTHGDYCLPNIFAKDGRVTGFIDIGRMGPADRWQDIAILIRTLHHNFNGYYGGPAVFPQFRPEMVLDELGIPMDEEKYRYYLLLDEI